MNTLFADCGPLKEVKTRGLAIKQSSNYWKHFLLYLCPGVVSASCLKINAFISRRGLAFYKDLKETLSKLSKKVDEFCQKREKDKAKFMELKKKEGIYLSKSSLVFGLDI